jgi:prevent-host-death family protein
LYKNFVQNREEKIMLTIAVSQLRTRLQYYLKKAEKGEQILITSHGKKVAALNPVPDKQTEARRKMAEIAKHSWVGDVVSPLGEDWKVLRDDYRP